MSSIATTQPATRVGTSPWMRGLVLGLFATLLAAILAAILASTVIGLANQGRVLPRVSVGGIDVGGLDRAGFEARLASSLTAVDRGAARIIIDGDQVTVTYAQVGRGYDMAGMSDAAFGTGRSGDPVTITIERLRTWLTGVALPVQVRGFEPTALDRISTDIAVQHTLAPANAMVTLGSDHAFRVLPARNGAQVDTRTVRTILGDALMTNDAGDVTVEIPVTSLPPGVTTQQAQDAAHTARAMAGLPLRLLADGDALSLTPAQLAPLLTFDADNGPYAPRADATLVSQAVAALAKHIDRNVSDATYRWGAKITVVPSVTGRTLDQKATAGQILAALDARASGDSSAEPIKLGVAVTAPKLTTEAAAASVSRLARIGTWTTYYHPGISNAYGANISIPARALNGLVIAPGVTFNFWRDIGPVTWERGYRYGGAIINGHTDLTGAFAGGICSTSTTMFNAALRAGLQMGERTNHSYYISRYPVGLDATVFADGSWVTNMTWTNDTAYPIIIRSFTSYGVVRFDLYSVPTGRSVTLTTPIITNRVAAHDTIQYTTLLAPGVKQRLEYVANGFDAQVTRYVRDRNGNVIHTDTFFSHYRAVNGILLVGKAPSPS